MPDTGWVYDPEWRAFTRWLDVGIQQVVYEESVVYPMEPWATEVGLDAETRERLRANPTPFSYNGSAPDWLEDIHGPRAPAQ